MDLKQLRARGAFIPLAPVVRSVTWARHDEAGEPVSDTFDVHIVKHSAGSIDRLRSDASENPDRLWGPLFLSESIRLGDDGSERLSYDDAFRLDPGLARLLIDEINVVNSTGGAAAKN